MDNQPNSTLWELGSDLPVLDPADDSYGYAPFAKQIASAIVSNKSPQGLVLAVHGKWGSGKSSLLNFIKHNLQQLPDQRRPILVDFNPWWFEGREQIASQLLEQFSSQLPDRLKQVRTLAKEIGRYSEQIADVAAGVSGYSLIKKPLAAVLGWIPGIRSWAEKTGIPSVKKSVASALAKSGKRFIFFVDDIDRLTPDEARDFFRAIKALGDFPEVIYVLFFDRDEVVKSLTTSLGMDGESYLEKIIQAPFHLPAVDKNLLYDKLFRGLDSIIDSEKSPFPFDQGRWSEIFSDGLDGCIQKPRDVVRILNAISVTYPPLAGEVNVVDLIALEFLRVFEPSTYESIREAKEYFAGDLGQKRFDTSREVAYIEKWRDGLPELSRERLSSLVGRIFPKILEALSRSHIAHEDYVSWRRELRVCSPECFDIYFQFGVPLKHVSRAELEGLIAQKTPEGIAEILMLAKDIIFSDGHSKARDLLERLRDFDNLDPDQASNLIEALVANAHLLLQKNDERGGFFSIPNRWRVSGLITKLLERLTPQERKTLLIRLANESPGIWSLVDLTDHALQALLVPSKAPKAMLDLDANFSAELESILAIRLDQAKLDDLLAMPELDFIVSRWSKWGDASCIRKVFEPMVIDDNKLLDLLDRFVRTGLRQSGREATETYRLSIKPLDFVMDLKDVEPRIRLIQSRSTLTARQRASTKQFILGLERMSEGKDPDEFYFNDSDE